MDLTGMSEQEYRWFVRECAKHSKLRPGEPVALDPGTIGLILTVVGLLLQVAGALLAPKPKDQEDKTPTEETIEGQNVVRRDRFAPKSGFDSFQNVVDMGSVVPIVYCKREKIGDVTYGGLRVNTNLLWSQVLSVGGGQFFRGIFLVGEAPVTLEHRQIALGNNTLASYELKKDAEAGRLTLYASDDGGRIKEDDYELGVIPANDVGNFDDADIYEVESRPDFCQALQPSNQVEFGVYSHIGNNFGYKLGEPHVASTHWQQGNPNFERQQNNQKMADAYKGAATFHTRAGFTELNGTEGTNDTESVQIDDVLTYRIFGDTDKDLKFDGTGGGSGQEAADANCRDVATSIASIQRAYDELINVGDMYRAGSATVICTFREEPFVSDVDYDGNGNNMRAEFTVIKPGAVDVWDPDVVNRGPYPGGTSEEVPGSADGNSKVVPARDATICSEKSQLFRMLIGAFSVERAFETIEVGLQSNVSLRSSGITNFNSLITKEDYGEDFTDFGEPYSYQSYIDSEFCGGLPVDNSSGGDYRKDIQPGTYNAADVRYSFFRISYRDIDNTSEEFTDSDNLYAVRSATGVDVYSFLRFKFAASKRREFRFTPVSSWEIRSDKASGKLYAIDPHFDTELSVNENGFEIEFIGEEVERSSDTFELRAFVNSNTNWGESAGTDDDRNGVPLGIAPHDDPDNFSYVDGWARIAEAFIYDGVSTTASEPEHKISYINIISENKNKPEYDKLATVGLNIRSSKELRSLDQLSVYVEEGVIDSHLFPDVFKDLLTNPRYGTGEFFDIKQIDTKSFDDAATWTYNQRYFFDGAISEKLNLRTWGAERARDFLLDLSVSGGKYTLNPTLSFEQLEPVAMFSSGNIIDETLQVNYFDIQDRLDPIVSVRWREERRDSSVDSKGLFPQIREFTVRRRGVNDDAPLIQVDMSNFCTNRKHAEDRAKLECQSKRYITHAVSFKTVPTQAGVQAGSIIKLGIETVTYQQPQNGVITDNGEVSSWPPLADGNYNVLIWDGKTLSNQTMTVQGGKASGPQGAVFCLESSTQKADTYKVSSVSFDEDGNVDIEALYWPSDKNGNSLLAIDWNNSGEWEISG